MPRRVLHVLSQRPSRTGSGVTLDSMVSCARGGWDQKAIVGTPGDDARPHVAHLDAADIIPLRFGSPPLDFPVPGMSDVMPYASSRFSSLTEQQIATYREQWRTHLGDVIDRFSPDLIHTHHVWILSSLIKDVAPHIPVVNHCHATGLRQMDLCPHLASDVVGGCARNDAFCVLHQLQREQLVAKLGVDAERVHVIGQGYREDVFSFPATDSDRSQDIAYAGKYSAAKGLPQLLDAFEILLPRRPDLRLHIAGSGSGEEADALRQRMEGMARNVILHGQLNQSQLAEVLRGCHAFVLPSFYEGLPLVLAEALACGCRLVCTDLPGVRDGFGQVFNAVLERVAPPRMVSIDQPDPSALPRFVEDLASGLAAALSAPAIGDPAQSTATILQPFKWQAVFERIERIWLDVLRC